MERSRRSVKSHTARESKERREAKEHRQNGSYQNDSPGKRKTRDQCIIYALAKTGRVIILDGPDNKLYHALVDAGVNPRRIVSINRDAKVFTTQRRELKGTGVSHHLCEMRAYLKENPCGRDDVIFHDGVSSSVSDIIGEMKSIGQATFMITLAARNGSGGETVKGLDDIQKELKHQMTWYHGYAGESVNIETGRISHPTMMTAVFEPGHDHPVVWNYDGVFREAGRTYLKVASMSISIRVTDRRVATLVGIDKPFDTKKCLDKTGVYGHLFR